MAVGTSSGWSTRYVSPSWTMVADPLATTFLSQSVPDPYGSAITNPSSVAKGTIGVSYDRPVVRPTCRMTEAYAPGVPAVFIWYGLPKARLNRRTTLRTRGDPVRIPTKNTTPIVTSTIARPTTTVATSLHIANGRIFLTSLRS